MKDDIRAVKQDLLALERRLKRADEAVKRATAAANALHERLHRMFIDNKSLAAMTEEEEGEIIAGKD